MVLALWRCKGSPTYFAKSDLERLRCHFIRPQGEARFITSSLPPHFNTTLWKDGKYHIDDLTLPLSSTLAVVYSGAGPTKCDVLEVPDSTVVRLNSGYFVSEPRASRWSPEEERISIKPVFSPSAFASVQLRPEGKSLMP